MNQEDWSAFLKAKLDDRNPKCGNCNWWSRGPDGRAYGQCLAELPPFFTTDLSLCSAWEKAPIKPDPE